MSKVKATVEMILAIVVFVAMWFSENFIPVYVNGNYVLANQLMRYALYLVLAGVIVKCFACLGTTHKKRPRRR